MIEILTMKNLTNKKIISLGIGMTIGFFIVELFNESTNLIKPIISGIITVGLLWLFKLVINK